jgi:hypothetical protein
VLLAHWNFVLKDSSENYLTGTYTVKKVEEEEKIVCRKYLFVKGVEIQSTNAHADAHIVAKRFSVSAASEREL